MTRAMHRLVCLGLLLAAAGCAFTDPYQREGVWRPNGSNATNLEAMVANPGDLVYGVGDGRTDGQLAAAAVERLYADKVKPLPDSALAQITVGSSGNTGNAGGAAPAAAAP